MVVDRDLASGDRTLESRMRDYYSRGDEFCRGIEDNHFTHEV